MPTPEYPNLTLLHLDTQTHWSISTECEYPQCSTSKDLHIFIHLIDSTKYITFSFFFKLGNIKFHIIFLPPQSISQKLHAFHGSQLEKILNFKYSWFFENYRPVNTKQRSHDVII